MIVWSQPAIDDMLRIQNVTAQKSGYAAALDASNSIEAAAAKLDQPMNGGKPGRLGIGEKEKLVDFKKKKSEFFIVYDEDAKGDIKILNVKHHLEQYP